MVNDLVRIGGAAIDYGAIAIALQLCARCVLCRSQGCEKLVLVPRAKEDVIAPFGVGIFDSVFSELRSLLDRCCARHITEPAGVRAADSDVDSPIGQALVNKIVKFDYGWQR